VGAIVHCDARTALELALIDPQAVEAPEGWNSKKLDLALRQAQAKGLIEVQDRATGDGSMAWWFVRPSLAGLRAIGQWPPAGSEHLPGSWDDGVWGKRDLLRLRQLLESPPHHGFVFGTTGGTTDDECADWLAATRLLEAGLLTGSPGPTGIADVSVTAEGQRAVAGVGDDPLDRAIVELERNAKVEAMTAAVEEALGDKLRQLANEHGVDATDVQGRPRHLAALNDALRAKPAYNQSWGAEIAGWIALRNETNHGRGKTVSATRIERAVAGIREFCDHA